MFNCCLNTSKVFSKTNLPDTLNRDVVLQRRNVRPSESIRVHSQILIQIPHLGYVRHTI